MPLPLLAAACRAALVAGLFFTSAAFGKTAWKPVAPEELAEKSPRIEAEAPAEILFWTIDVDDRDFPFSRKRSDYIRYKIYAPDKVEAITRISTIDEATTLDRMDVSARLVLPDGKIREFGKESIKERTLTKQARTGGVLGWLGAADGPVVRERFLAITGVEVGAILEYQIDRVDRSPDSVDAVVGQREEIPVRKFNYAARLLKDSEWLNRCFVSNSRNAAIKDDRKAGTLTVAAENLPSIAEEPFEGPATDHALTILNCYEPVNMLLAPRSGRVPLPGDIDTKAGPWTAYATVVNWIERDRGYATSRVKKFATDLTQPIPGEAAKARAIHQHVERLLQFAMDMPTPKREDQQRVDSLDDVLDIEKKKNVVPTRDDFLWLAVALYRGAGLECRVVLLPDRRLTRFDPRNVSAVFLPNRAAQVRVDGKWMFSAPHSRYTPAFGMLPWMQEGQAGLLALPRVQEFIDVPAAGAEESIVGTLGRFTLDADGLLAGEVRRRLTGHAARVVRAEWREEKNEQKRHELAVERIGLDPKKAEVKITQISGLESSDKMLEVVATVQWPGYAIRTKDRLVLRTAVFRADDAAPFSATVRRHPIHFTYRWQEVDDVRITIPPGFAPDAPTAPASLPGDVLSYKTSLGFDPGRNILAAKREFASHLIDVPVEAYPKLKSWYDVVTRADQHEVVLARKAAGPANTEK